VPSVCLIREILLGDSGKAPEGYLKDLCVVPAVIQLLARCRLLRMAILLALAFVA